MNDLISVIVPVYNVEAYLKRCVESIIKQDYKNLEIILVDDGSTDNCPQICNDYAKKDSRIKVIHKTNGGLSDARNAGMKIAKGEYIAFVDSDDWIGEDMFSTLIQTLKKYKADIAECKYFITDTTKITKENINSDYKEIIFNTEDALRELILDGYLKNVVWNKLYKRSVISNNIFPFGKISEDVYWTYKVFANAKTIVYVNNPIYFYFQRPGSIMNKTYNIKRLDSVWGQEERLYFIKKNFPNLFGLAEKRFFLFILYNYEYILANVNCDSNGIHRKKLWSWVRENILSLIKNPVMAKYKILAVLFYFNPNLVFRFRKTI